MEPAPAAATTSGSATPAAEARFIPDRIDDMDARWLSDALRLDGALRDASIERVDVSVLGEGSGFMGVMARLGLTFDREEPGAPRSVIGKLPTAVRKNRGMGELLGAYERELCFYTEFASDVPIRKPHIYYADFDRDATSEKQEQILRVVDKLPRFLMRATMPLGRWIAMRKERRYALVMEDLGNLRAGDQVAGASPADAEKALRALAGAHAKLWESPLLENRFWLLPQTIQARSRHYMFKRARKGFRKLFPELYASGFEPLMAWLSKNGIALLRRLHSEAPETLMHGDMRLDNLFFTSDGEVVFIDWQLVGRGAGAYDVAYLLGGSLRADVSTEEESRLLRAYHGALLSGGVKDYPYERLERDYRRGLMVCVQLMTSIDQVDLTNERGRLLIQRWLERLLLRTRDLDLDALLA